MAIFIFGIAADRTKSKQKCVKTCNDVFLKLKDTLQENSITLGWLFNTSCLEHHDGLDQFKSIIFKNRFSQLFV